MQDDRPILEYGPAPHSRWKRAGALIRRHPILLGVLLELPILMFVFSFVPIRTEKGWICSACASERTQTVWPLEIARAPAVQPSALADWMVKQGRAHLHDWRLVKGFGQNIFGQRISSGHGTAPPVYQLRPLVQMYVDAATDAEIAEFVEVMEHGTHIEQSHAVQRAAERALPLLFK